MNNAIKQGIAAEVLVDLYEHRGRSMQQIAAEFGCSQNKVAYWMA